jgi:hypothetical protein
MKREKFEFWIDSDEGGYWAPSMFVHFDDFMTSWLNGLIFTPYRMRVKEQWVVLPASERAWMDGVTTRAATETL